MLKLASSDSSFSRIENILVESSILKQNLAGISHVRQLSIYIPNKPSSSYLPVLYVLAPWTNAGRQVFEWQNFQESLQQRLDRLIQSKKMPEAVVVAPDLFTYFGGSQYINSSYLGLHGDFIVHELFPYIEQNFPVARGAAHRGIFGRSSGGFGALRLAMDYPGQIAGVAAHSADLGFETTLKPTLIDLAEGLASYDCKLENFLSAFDQAKKRNGKQIHLMMLIGLSAIYSPNTEKGFDLPIDIYTARVREDIWQKWLEHDPVWRLEVQQDYEGLERLNSLYFDCGSQDQYWLHYGARQLEFLLKKRNLSFRYEEFKDNHSSTSYRFDESLPGLVTSLV